MGEDPRTSVCTSSGRLHDVDNVFVADASTFPTFPGFNPTLTILANSIRIARGIAANLAERLAFLTDPLEGDFSTKNDGIQNEAKTLDERIEELEERLASKEERIQREFTQLELILSQNNSTLAQLNSTCVAFTNFRTGANKK